MSYSKSGRRNMMRFVHRYGPYAPAAGRMIAKKLSAAWKSRSGSMTQRKKSGTRSGQGITTQRDQRQIYTKKYMPRSKKKRWKSFVRKVNAASEKELGSRQVVFNKNIDAVNVLPSNHAELGVCLYSQTSTTSTYNDLKSISALENDDPTVQTRATGAFIYDSTKWIFQSAILDITVRNTSVINVSGPAVQFASEAKMEFDVYELLISKPAQDGTTGLVDIGALWAQNTARTEKLDNATAEINHQQRGVTPFELSYALSKYGVKILKKTKYMLPNNECFTYQIRDPKRRSITQQDIETYAGFNRPGWTRVLWIVGKLVPGLTIAGAGTVGAYQERFQIGVTRKYLYKIEGMSEDRTAYENL